MSAILAKDDEAWQAAELAEKHGEQQDPPKLQLVAPPPPEPPSPPLQPPEPPQERFKWPPFEELDEFLLEYYRRHHAAPVEPPAPPVLSKMKLHPMTYRSRRVPFRA